MTDKQRINVRMEMTQEIRGLLNAVSQMDKEAQGELKDTVKGISAWVADEIKRAAAVAPMPDQAMKVARTVRAVKDRVPYVTIGGSAVAFSGGAKSGQIVIGNEFGAYPESEAGMLGNGGRRFPYRSPREGRGNKGYWIFSTTKALQPRITAEWHGAIDNVLDNWHKKAV